MIQPWQVMWGIAFAIYLICKLVTWVDVGCPRSLRAMGYLFAWPGLDAKAFIYGEKEVSKPSEREWSFAISKMFIGVLLFWGVAKLMPSPILAGLVGMIGIVFILHFGYFHLMSCAWRSIEVDAEPLMNWPMFATGLGDFWKRWNTAFYNFTHKFLFRPLSRMIGMKNIIPTTMASFLFSGLIHDVVISIPAGGGYGGPTAFFALQAIGLSIEFKLRKKKKKLTGWKGRLFAMVFLVPPSILLFHKPFILNVIVPFMKAAGALP